MAKVQRLRSVARPCTDNFFVHASSAMGSEVDGQIVEFNDRRKPHRYRALLSPHPTARTLIPIDHAARSNSSSENSTLRDERLAIACAITTRYGYGMMAYQSLIDNNRLSEQSGNPLSRVLAI